MSARISHTDHDHPNTPAARSACRKRMNAGKSPMDASAERALGDVKKVTPLTEQDMKNTQAARSAFVESDNFLDDVDHASVSEDVIIAARARLAQAIAFDGYGVATITSYNENNGEMHAGTYKVYEIHADGFEVKEYSGMEDFIYFHNITGISE